MPAKERDGGALQAEDGAGGADRGAGAPQQTQQRAAHRARDVEQDELAPPERVLADHAQDEERDRIAEQMVEAAVQERRAEQAPILSGGDGGSEESADGHDAVSAVERVSGHLDGVNEGEQRDEADGDAGQAAHPALEIHPSRQQHVRRDAKRDLGVVRDADLPAYRAYSTRFAGRRCRGSSDGDWRRPDSQARTRSRHLFNGPGQSQRPSPVSSITPRARPTRRSRRCSGSLVRSRT